MSTVTYNIDKGYLRVRVPCCRLHSGGGCGRGSAWGELILMKFVFEQIFISGLGVCPYWSSSIK